MKKTIGIAILLIGSFCFLLSCQQSDFAAHGKGAVLQLPEVPYSYDSASGNNNNIPTLGRVLFYDSRLSANGGVSCASCHKQALAFADNVSFSIGFNGKKTLRNSMPIQNLNVSPGFNGGGVFFPGNNGDPGIISDSLSLFWDGRSKILKAMVLQPILNHVEMGISDLNSLASKIAEIPDYQILFKKAYGTTEVTPVKIADALSNFLTNIKSGQTRFDARNNNSGTLSAQETMGMALFTDKYNCNSCHQIFVLNGYQLGGGDSTGATAGFINIGLDQQYQDIGKADVTGNQKDVGKFKIPTLRNVALTAPYMHDGRYSSLEEVVDHYSHGIVDHPNLDKRLRTSEGPLKMNISDTEKQAIVAFLHTLTDYNMITDPRFSNPFVAAQ